MSAGAACFVQTCDQVISGRQFNYDRALEIVQEEEYLEDSDFDDIKRYDILKKIGDFNPDFNIPKSRQHNNWLPVQDQQSGHQNYTYNGKFSIDHYDHTQRNGSQTHPNYKYETEFEPDLVETHESKVLSRVKRCAGLGPCFGHMCALCPCCPCGDPFLLGLDPCHCPSCTTESSDGPIDQGIHFKDYDSELIGMFDEHHHMEKRSIYPFNISSFDITTAKPTTAASPMDEAVQTAAQAGGALGAGMVGMAMMMPDLNFQQSGSPGGSTAAGTAGGGGLPTNGNIASLALSLALVPLGLAAVAVFPPFATPRTVPAVAVIFSEGRDMRGTIRKRDVRRLYRIIKKRSSTPFWGPEFWIGNAKVELPSYSQIKYAVQEKQPRTVDFLTTAYNSLSRFRVWIAKKMYKRLSRPMKRLVKKFGRVEALMHKKLVCMTPRLKRRYGQLVYPEGLTVKAIKEKKKNFENFVKYGNAEDADVEYVEDCFDDMERPKFGWTAKVTLMKDEPCELNFENPEQSTCILSSNSDGEADSNYYAQSRQTGEGFRSAATPDCRIEYVCDTPPNTQAQAQPAPAPAQPAPAQPAPALPAPAQPASAQPAPDAIAPDAQGVGIIQNQPQPGQLQSIQAQPAQAQPNPAQPPPVQPAPALQAQAQLAPAQPILAQGVRAPQVPGAADFGVPNQAQQGQPQPVQLQPLPAEPAPVQPIPAQPDLVQPAPWQPVVPISTYVQGKQPSNSVYFNIS